MIHCCPYSEFTDDFEELHENLKFFQKLLSKDHEEHDESEILKLMKKSIRAAIKNSFCKNESLESVRSQIGILCNEHLAIPTNHRQWAMSEVETIYKCLPVISSPMPQPQVSSEPPIPSLFSHDILYHAGLCCHVVSTCTAATFQASLNTLGSGHLLEEASMSISQDKENVDRYMIARQADKIYMSFQSEASIKTWMNDYNSFDEGEFSHACYYNL